eukprot:g14246.t1
MLLRGHDALEETDHKTSCRVEKKFMTRQGTSNRATNSLSKVIVFIKYLAYVPVGSKVGSKNNSHSRPGTAREVHSARKNSRQQK